MVKPKFASGKPIVSWTKISGSPWAQVTHYQILEAEPRDIIALGMDWSRLADYSNSDDMINSELVTEAAPNEDIVEITLKPFPLFGIETVYQTSEKLVVAIPNKKYVLEVEMVKNISGAYRNVKARWTVEKLGIDKSLSVFVGVIVPKSKARLIPFGLVKKGFMRTIDGWAQTYSQKPTKISVERVIRAEQYLAKPQ